MTGIELALVIGAVVVVVGLLSFFLLRGRSAPDTTLDSPPPAPTTPDASTAQEVATDVARGPPAVEAPPVEPAPAPAPVEAPLTLAERFSKRLSRTRNVLSTGIADLFGRGIDDAAWEGLEEMLISADVGVETTLALVERLRERTRTEGVTTSDGVVALLRDELLLQVDVGDRTLARSTDGEPTVWLVTGVNGTGKTTTIGKLAKAQRDQGRKVMLAAGDTFRAAAIEQLKRWGERNEIPVVAQHTGADSASVVYDALESATSRGVEVLIADTAGRLHTQSDLMEELKKVRRVINKLDPEAPHEVLLVLDAGTGQNALTQAVQFHQAIGITGLCITKLDGTAKGGVVFAIAERLGVPIRYIGVGENLDDLRKFDANAFVQALLAR